MEPSWAKMGPSWAKLALSLAKFGARMARVGGKSEPGWTRWSNMEDKTAKLDPDTAK